MEVAVIAALNKDVPFTVKLYPPVAEVPTPRLPVVFAFPETVKALVGAEVPIPNLLLVESK